MLREGYGFFRVEAEVEHGDAVIKRAVAYDRVQGVRVDPGGGPAWLPPGSVLCFSPDDLQLIKGAPAGRRRFLDDAICLRIPSHHRTLLDYQKVLAQRNSFLHRAKAGLTRLADISTWDRQLAALAPGDGEAASPEKAQTIITAADAGLFTEAELAGAFVLEVASGAVREARAGLGV